MEKWGHVMQYAPYCKTWPHYLRIFSAKIIYLI